MEPQNPETTSIPDTEMTRRPQDVNATPLPPIPENEVPVNNPPASVPRATASSGVPGQRVSPSERTTGSRQSVYDTYAGWNRYAESHKIVFNDESDWEDEEFARFMDELKYPKSMGSENIMSILKEELEETPRETESIDDFKAWYSEKIPEQFEDGDAYKFERRLVALVLLWLSISSKLAEKGSEAAHRKPVDSLIELAFQLRRGATQVWRPETELVLPDSPESVRVDAIVTKALPSTWLRIVSSYSKQYVFSWSWDSVLSTRDTSIITFCFEAKLNDLAKVLRQLQLDFYCAQLHRRALGMKDGPVFGAILNEGVLSLYVSFWEADTLMVQPLPGGPYYLNMFSRFIESYFILCRIAEFQNQWADEEFKRWDQDKQSQLTKLRGSLTPPWRNKVKPTVANKRPRTDDGNGGSGGRNAPGSGPRDDDGRVETVSVDACEVQRIKAAVVRGDPAPEAGHPLNSEHLFVLNELSGYGERVREKSIMGWLQRTNACSGNYTHMYSPEYDGYFRDDASSFDDRAPTMVGECESNTGTLVEHHTDFVDDAMMGEQMNEETGLKDLTMTSGKILINTIPRGTKYLDTVGILASCGIAQNSANPHQVTAMVS